MKAATKADDAAVFTVDPSQWLHDHGDALFSYAMMHLRDTAVSEELVQDTFLAALRSAPSFEGRSTERVWLISILKHKIIDLIRKRARRASIDVDIEDDLIIERRFQDDGHFLTPLNEWSGDPVQALEQKQFGEVLASCVEGLPEKLAQVFTLRELEQWSAEEICKDLNISATNLWVILHRARLRLRDCLNAKWFAGEQKA
ncbi:MAG: sigma-70 family RNA polymerase sigma factor [Caldilineaceae bacterium]|nr:sigma-70 family RNA polymerase sigma factor [Caldilineaceae bacterium]